MNIKINFTLKTITLLEEVSIDEINRIFRVLSSTEFDIKDFKIVPEICQDYFIPCNCNCRPITNFPYYQTDVLNTPNTEIGNNYYETSDTINTTKNTTNNSNKDKN